MRRMVALAACVLLGVPAEADAEWLSLRSEHVLVIGNASERQIRTVALKFEQFRDAVSQALNLASLRNGTSTPVVVIVFAGDRSYEPFVPLVNGRTERVAGFFQPGQDLNYITLSLQAGDLAYSVIFHEYAHALLRGRFADAPVWFNEGLAEYYRTFQVSGGGRVAQVGMPIRQHLQLLQSRRMPFARLFAVNRQSPEYTRDNSDRRILYAQSWAIIHHAMHGGPGRWDQLLTFLDRVTEGRPTEASIREAFGSELRDLEASLQAYIQRPTLQSLSIPLPERTATRLDARITRMSDAEADAWLGDLLSHMSRDEEAVARLDKALAVQPELAAAHASLGSLRFRQKKTAEAIAHFEQAMSLGIDNETTYFWYAYALLGTAPMDPESLTKASKALERAIEIRPGYGEAKLILAYAYIASGRYAAARDLLHPVVRDEPANHRAAVRLGEALLRLNELEAAVSVLNPVLARATDESDRTRAQDLLDVAVDRGARGVLRLDTGTPASR